MQLICCFVISYIVLVIYHSFILHLPMASVLDVLEELKELTLLQSIVQTPLDDIF